MTASSSCRAAVAAALVALAFSACPTAAPTPKPVDTSVVKQVVGAAGGTLVHATGAKLVVPPGALSSDVELSMTGAEAPSATQTGAPAVGQAFVLGPEGQQFAAPLTIEVPVDPALVQQLDVGVDELRLRLAPQSTMAFVELATTADTARQVLTAQLTHFSVIVPVAASNPFTFQTSGLPAASVGVAYSGALIVSGGTAPYTWSVVAGALPPGLMLSAQGTFSGTPTQAGTFLFTARVTDGASASAEAVVAMEVGGVGQCNSVPNSGSLVAEQRVASAAPAPAGGTFVQGTWVRAASTVYTGAGGATGPTGNQGRQAIRITEVNGSLRFDSVYQEPGGSLDLLSGAASFSGTQLTVNFNCPQSGTKVFGYTATASTFALYEAVSGGTKEIVFVPEGSSGTDGGVGPSDGGTQGDGGTAGDGGTPACSAPAAGGALVAEQFSSGISPQPTGGTVPDGEYELISDTLYESDAGTSGPTGVQRKQTLRIAGNAVSTTIVDGSGTQALQFSLTYAGPTMVVVQTCPAGANTLYFAYSMLSGTDLQLARGSSRGTVVSVYRLVGGGGDGGTTTDAGVDAGIDVLGTGFTDLVDLAYDPASAALFTLGNGTVNRCDSTGCGGTGTGTVVTNVYASSLAVNANTLFVTTDFRNVKSCDVTSCTLSTFVDVGANSYPAHLAVANNRVYWMSESGASRRIQACPLTGCGAGPTLVYGGAELDGLFISGVAVDASAVYVSIFTGGVWRIPLSNPDTGGAAVSVTGSNYGTGGLVVDGSTLGWAEANDNRVMACTLPGCASPAAKVTGLRTPSGLAFDATYVYGADRGTPNGSGGYVAGTARVWRWLKQ
jgi:hypothetical protein